jgi:signal transduction histidine kinase
LFGDEATLPGESVAMLDRIAAVEMVTAISGIADAKVYRNDKISRALSGGIAVYSTRLNLLATVGGTVTSGAWFNEATAQYPATVLGAKAAERLGIGTVHTGMQIWLGGQWFTVIGVLDPIPLVPSLDLAALIGWQAGERYLDSEVEITTLYVRTNPGAVEAVCSILARTANPAAPNEVDVSRPSDALAAEAAAESAFTGLLLGLGAVALLVGGIGVANTMVISDFQLSSRDRSRDTMTLTPSLPLSRVVLQGSLPNWPRFRLALNPAANADQRLDFLLRQSTLSISEPIVSGQDASPVGTLVLSEGPAFGRAILRSVVWGWAFAGLSAVLLAVLLGWYLSRRISAPILALTEVTTRMAQGDLSSRANVKGQDEFGQLAHSFNEMAEQVDATITTLHRFVADAAHELYTPLTALYADLDLAAQEQDAAAQIGFVRRAQATVLRLKSLTNKLLALSRLEAQADPEPPELLDLTGLLRQTAELYASQAEQAELNFSLQAPDEAVYIRAHLPQRQVALDNLFDNACKFTPSGGDVTIQLQQSGVQVQLSVTDTGIGIPPDDLPLLFSRFHRSRNATNYPGSGLGLAIVKAIIEQQGGQVMVENTTPGTRFTLHWAALSAILVAV